ncbi:MAG: hypothetical protein RBT64_12835 [Trichloromonas sp.]|jgi:hypothetical protein|nr:hypothetical protein [Trichloromonas sp.]
MNQDETSREQIPAVTPREAVECLIESQKGLWTVDELLRALELAASNEGAQGEQRALDWTLILPALMNQVQTAADLLEPVELLLKEQQKKALREVEKAEERITARQAAFLGTMESLKCQSSSVEVNHECRCR